MEPKGLRFGGGLAETAIHPAVAVAVIVAALLILLLPRKRLYLPFLLATFLIPFGEVVVVGGIHFLTPRIVILFGLIRILISRFSSKERTLPGGFNLIDKLMILWSVTYGLAFIFLYLEWGAVVNRVGVLLDSLGGYMVIRYLIQDLDDVYRYIKVFALIAVVMAVCMMNEQYTHRNVFGDIGGERSVPETRSGRVRSQAAFHHPLLAGGFGATILPLFVGLWSRKKEKIAIVGMAASMVMTVTSAESTTLLALLAGLLGLCLWHVRRHMRAIRWGIAGVLLALHMVMKAPVWALIERIDLTGSSTSYDRFILIDNFIRHFGAWWLFGAKDYNTWGLDMWDLCNQYVAYGETGGLATLVFFIGIIVFSFAAIKKARMRLGTKERKQEWFLWCLWAALFSDMVIYFGLGWDDQTELAWYSLLVMISVATIKVVSKPAPAESRKLLEPEPAFSI